MTYDEMTERELLAVVAEGLDGIARALRLLGNADAATPMGALEALGKVHEEASVRLAGAVEEAARDIAEGLGAIAEAITAAHTKA